MDIAATALAAARNDRLLAMRGDVGELGAGVVIKDQRAAGNLDVEIVSVAAVHLLAAPGNAVLGEKLRAVIEALEGILVVIANKNDMAAATAVAAIRAAFFNAGLAAETGTAVAALAGAGMHHHAVNEFVYLHS